MAGVGTGVNWNTVDVVGVCWFDDPKTKDESVLGAGAGVVLERAPNSGTLGVVPEDPPKEGAAGVATAGT